MKSLITSIALIAVASCAYTTQQVKTESPDGTVTTTPVSVALQDSISENQKECYDNQLSLAKEQNVNAPANLSGIEYALVQMANALETMANLIKPVGNPCATTNMADVELAKQNKYTVLTDSLIDNSFGLLTAIVPWKYGAKVLTSAFDAAGDAYEIGDISQSTNYVQELAGAEGGEGAAGGPGSGDGDGTGGAGGPGAPGGGATGGAGTNGNNSINIGRGNASGIAGAEAFTSTGTKSGNENIDDRDGINSSDVDAAVDVSFPLSQ